jgi:RNA polymerase sigma-70 factor (ECF subfamily)
MGLSFDEAFESEFPALHRYLHRRVGAAAAEDLAAATFVTALRRWDQFDQTRPLRPWLYGIAANLARHHWRSERRQLRAYARSGIDPISVEDGDTLERVDAHGLQRELAAALAGLRARDREILLLHAWAELSDAEIATALSLPLGTVKSRLHRTRERLRNQLGELGQEGERTSVIATPKEQG